MKEIIIAIIGSAMIFTGFVVALDHALTYETNKMEEQAIKACKHNNGRWDNEQFRCLIVDQRNHLVD